MLRHNLQCISDSRLSPYIKLCKGKQAEAICVYTTLQHRLAQFFTVIQEIEIIFRNALSEKMQFWLENAPHSPKVSLYDYFQHHMAAYLTVEGKKQLTKALNEVQLRYSNHLKKAGNDTTKVKQPDHNDIISHLTFGFWVYLLEQDPKKNANCAYWNAIFNDLFDNRFASNNDLFTQMKNVLRFRNNLYHQEAVWKGKNIKNTRTALQNLAKKFRTFFHYLELLSPQRFAVVQLSYQSTHTADQIFELHAFEKEVQSLHTIFVSTGLTV